MKRFLFLLIVLVSMAQIVFGQEISDSKDRDLPPTDFHQFFPELGRNFTAGLFSEHNIFPLLIGGIGVSIVYPYDKELSNELSPHARTVGTAGEILGGPVVFGVVAGSLIAAPFTENTRFRAFAFDSSQAYIMNFTIVQTMKLAFGRTRPNGNDNSSFPSGHAADSFMLATVLNHNYGWKIGIPAYAAATFVAFSRIEKKKHFPTDVIFGGTLGYVMAKTAIRTHQRSAAKNFGWMPFLGRHELGFAASWNF